MTNYEDDEEFLNMIQQNEMLGMGGTVGGDPLGNNSISAVSNNLSQGGWDKAIFNMTPEE